jgi:hypothetical protein
LIRDGAFPVFDPGDLIEELSLIHHLATTRGEGLRTDQASGVGDGEQ